MHANTNANEKAGSDKVYDHVEVIMEMNMEMEYTLTYDELHIKKRIVKWKLTSNHSNCKNRKLLKQVTNENAIQWK